MQSACRLHVPGATPPCRSSGATGSASATGDARAVRNGNGRCGVQSTGRASGTQKCKLLFGPDHQCHPPARFVGNWTSSQSVALMFRVQPRLAVRRVPLAPPVPRGRSEPFGTGTVLVSLKRWQSQWHPKGQGAAGCGHQCHPPGPAGGVRTPPPTGRRTGSACARGVAGGTGRSGEGGPHMVAEFWHRLMPPAVVGCHWLCQCHGGVRATRDGHGRGAAGALAEPVAPRSASCCSDPTTSATRPDAPGRTACERGEEGFGRRWFWGIRSADASLLPQPPMSKEDRVAKLPQPPARPPTSQSDQAEPSPRPPAARHPALDHGVGSGEAESRDVSDATSLTSSFSCSRLCA